MWLRCRCRVEKDIALDRDDGDALLYSDNGGWRERQKASWQLKTSFGLWLQCARPLRRVNIKNFCVQTLRHSHLSLFVRKVAPTVGATITRWTAPPIQSKGGHEYFKGVLGELCNDLCVYECMLSMYMQHPCTLILAHVMLEMVRNRPNLLR